MIQIHFIKKTLTKFVYYGKVLELQLEKQSFNEDEFKKKLGNIILNGHFKGIKYPFKKSISSGYFPKIIGSYEFELNDIWSRILKTDFDKILDIGCAEGYYAVGLAMNYKDKTIEAFDNNKDAIKLCKKLAEENGVSNIKYNDSIDPEKLKQLATGHKLFVLCDVDGYEYDLFNENNIDSLKSSTLLIETHDVFNLLITTRLNKLFEKTHDIEIVKSIDDIEKAKTYNFNINVEDIKTKKILYSEGRIAIQEWYYLTPKNNHERN